MGLLDKVVALENEAHEFGFRWETADQIMAQIESECVEIREHLNQTKGQMNQLALQEEIGDLLHATFSLCVFCSVSPEDTLDRALKKFELRLNTVKVVAKERGFVNLNGFSFDSLMAIWQQAKGRISHVQPGKIP